MPIDAYSLCPGGTGKKIKFCCHDLLGDLEKISRMLEGDQQLACLNYIEQLQEKHPDRACLFSIKGELLRVLERLEEAEVNALAFFEKHPENTTAMSEAALMTAVAGRGLEAAALLHRALAASAGEISSRIYEAMGVVAQALLAEGEWLAGRALLELQAVIARDDRQPSEMLYEMAQSPHLPLLLKEGPRREACPDDAPWKARFDEAMSPVAKGDWRAAAERLTALADEIDDAPSIWQNLAALRGWLADKPGCIEALRKFAALAVPLEDAAEAEATAMWLADDPLGDRLDMLSLTWTAKDIDQLQAALSLQSRASQVPFDPPAGPTGERPAPRSVYLLLDRPVVDSTADVSLDTISRVIGQAMLFGRQTDREAQLQVIGVVADDVEAVKKLIGETAGETLEGDAEETVMSQVSASQEMLQMKWRPPRDVTPEQLERLAADHRRDVLLNHWPLLELGIFDGKSAREVAGDEACRARLLGALMVLEFWAQRIPGTFDFNALRSELGLPTLDPIDPQETPVDWLPLVRLSRVMVEKASDEVLVGGFRRARAFGAAEALQKFSRAVIERPNLAGSNEQAEAYGTLVRTAGDPEQAIQYIEQGRQAALSAGQSCAHWDLMELSYCFSRGDGAGAQRLIQHLQDRHIEEEGVAEALTHLLVQVGILRPDGTPATPPPVQQEPIVAAADQPDPQPGKLWTPDSQQPGGKGKIWTPD